jgi:predicted acyltransferase
MVSCGLASLLLALLTWIIDKKKHQDKLTDFFHVFGVNPLALFVLSDILLIPLGIILFGGSSIRVITYKNVLLPVLGIKAASLAWAILYVCLNWCVGYILFKKKIYIKL